jgi:hypothetical protein
MGDPVPPVAGAPPGLPSGGILRRAETAARRGGIVLPDHDRRQRVFGGPDSSMSDATPQSSGPNPLCEIGRTHPRDKHRMKPIEGQSGIWECPRHEIFARILPLEEAEALDRGDAFAMHDGREGVVVRLGDERGGGQVVYYRFEG